MTRSLHLFPAAILLLSTLPLHANSIAPGQTVAPDIFSLATTPPILDQISGTFSLDGGALTGSYVEGVLVDPFGVTCAGCLDFFFQVTIDSASTDTVSRLGLDSLKGTATDVGYVTGSGDTAPSSVLWASNATTLSFFLNLSPGQTTDALVIATNATSYAARGSLGIGGINSAGAFNNGLGLLQGQLLPVAPAPEPGLGALLTIGLLSLAALTRRSSSSPSE